MTPPLIYRECLRYISDTALQVEYRAHQGSSHSSHCFACLEEMHHRGMGIAPELSLLEDVERHVAVDLQKACRTAQYEESAGENVTAYRDLMGRIDRSIGVLKRFRREVQAVAKHAHQWDNDDYCSICGADGRA